MFRSNLKLIFRQLRSTYSFINLLGLTVGFTVFTLIFLWVNDELSYDRFHKDYENIYRVVGNQLTDSTSENLMATTCAPLADYLKTNFGEVKESCRVRQSEFFMKYKDGGFYNKGIMADPSFFNLFSFPLKQGKLESFREGVDKVIISQRLAETYFGKADAMGKVFLIAGRDVVVVGVLEDVPSNSHLQFDYVIPIKFAEAVGLFELNQWTLYLLYTYIKTNPLAAVDLEEKIKDVIFKNDPEATTELKLQPLKNTHLKSATFSSDLNGHGNIIYVYLFSSIALFILVIASINYSNLATARSIKRSKETGVRKVMGSSRTQLVSFFLFESSLYCLLALSLAFFVSWLLLPHFNELVGKQLVLDLLSPTIILPLLFFTMLCAVVGGAYPALVLSGQNPAIVFRGMAKAGSRTVQMRRALVVIQFILSIGLLSGTFIIQRQLKYIETKNLGYEKEKIISFTMIRKIRQNYTSIKNELLALPAVKSVTANNQSISFNDYWTDSFSWEGKNPDDNRIFHQLIVDVDFLKTYNVALAAGRDFSGELVSDSSAMLINEETATQMGLVDPVNKVVKLQDKSYTIIGVVNNFHFKSIHKKIEPLLLYIEPTSFYQISIKLNNGNVPEQLRAIEAVFKKFTPDRPFDYTFLEDDIEKTYTTESRIGKIFVYFTSLAIFISCLGLLGIILFVTEQRAKELAIRKVLGSSVYKIVLLLSVEYIIMTIIGFAIATPLVYYAMDKWLNNFAYRAEIHFSLFLIAGGVAILITWLTVAYRSYQAATDNPVKSLRSE
jgi:putative ABC transport system permease protein